MGPVAHLEGGERWGRENNHDCMLAYQFVLVGCLTYSEVPTTSVSLTNFLRRSYARCCLARYLRFFLCSAAFSYKTCELPKKINNIIV